MSTLELSVKHPATLQVSGQSRCGNTRLMLRILQHQLIQPFNTIIIWVNSENQPNYLAAQAIYPHIEFVHGCKYEIYSRINLNTLNLLVVYDQIDQVGNSTLFQSKQCRFSK